MRRRKKEEEYKIRMKSMASFTVYMIALIVGMVTIENSNNIQRMVIDSIILASYTQYLYYEYFLRIRRRVITLDFLITILWLNDFLVNFIILLSK